MRVYTHTSHEHAHQKSGKSEEILDIQKDRYFFKQVP